MQYEIVLAFPQPMTPVRAVRSTLLLGALASLEAEGLLPAYSEVVPREVRETIQGAIAGMWIPLGTALAHYKACDALRLPSESMARLGRSTFVRTKGLLLGAATGIARGAGVTPWAFVPHLQRFWLRGVDGGGIQALRIGPKEVRMDLLGCPLLQSHYFRAACRGLVGGLFELVCSRAYVHDQPLGDAESSISFRVQWA